MLFIKIIQQLDDFAHNFDVLLKFYSKYWHLNVIFACQYFMILVFCPENGII